MALARPVLRPCAGGGSGPLLAPRYSCRGCWGVPGPEGILPALRPLEGDRPASRGPEHPAPCCREKESRGAGPAQTKAGRRHVLPLPLQPGAL